jgi:diadenosine tetraphosphatase ApaH/serine/threonine PP2A family protein phosphatase
MRVAVISDVHGNEHALVAVLAAVSQTAPDRVWCLGDTVGYGPRPNECCELVGAHADVCLVGNHDLVAVGALDVEDFNHDAAAAARWTGRELSDASRSWLAGLEPEAHVDGAGLFHASARDPVWEYVLSGEAALASLHASEEPLVLVGHSHVALAIGLVADALEGDAAPDGTRLELSSGRWLLNPGSVGQPRDGDPRAAWLEIDLDAEVARFHRVEYPVDRTQAEIREAGLPAPLAERLASGI